MRLLCKMCWENCEKLFTEMPFCGIMEYTERALREIQCENKREMTTIRRSRFYGLRQFLASVSKYTWAALALTLAFFVLCACTIGGFSSTGGSFYAATDSEIVFYLDYQNSAKLDAVYVNVGAVHASVGSTVKFELRRSSVYSTGPGWMSTYLGEAQFGNVFSFDEDVSSDTGYNWTALFEGIYTEDGHSITNNLIRITVPCDMVINEVVFVGSDGEIIPAYTTEADARSRINSSYWSQYRDLFAANDKMEGSANLTDAQGSLRTGKTTYSKFTQDEAYMLAQIDNILLGNRSVEGTYFASKDNGPLAVLFPLLGVLVFGKSLFGLRIFSVLFTAGCVLLAYFFARKLFKSDGFGLLFAFLFAFGGLALTVGRLGLALPSLAFFVLASAVSMLRFFENGISETRPVRSALGSVLLSGVFFGLAVAIDPKAIWTILLPAALFVIGLVRMSAAHKARVAALNAETSAKNAAERSEEVIRENLENCEEEEALLGADHSYRLRIAWLLFVFSFLVGTVLFTVLAAIPSVPNYMRLYEADPENPTLGLFTLIWRAVRDAFTVSDYTAYTSANAVSVFGWLIGLKGATLYSASTETTYIAVNAQLNIAMWATALVGFLFSTVYAVLYFATGGKNSPYATEHSPRILSAYAVLLAGVLGSLFAYAGAGEVSAVQSFLFSLFYLGFIPLLFYTAYVHDRSAKKKIFGLRLNYTMQVLFGLCAVYLVVFALTVPMLFCIPVSAAAATALFGWTTFLGNGYYRI